MSATMNPTWREDAIRRVFDAMSEKYDEAWDVGCWEHGTGQFFAEIAVDTFLSMSGTLAT